MSRWFRHYAGMMRDEKLVRVAVKAKQPVERVVWVWGAILESAAEINDGGRFEFDIGEAAYFLRCDEGELGSILSALDAMGRISQGIVVRWGDRQFDSDKSRDRQAAYRQRQKTSREVESDVTPPSRDSRVTLQETETDTNSEANASGAASPADPRTELWRDGVSILVAISGKPERSVRQLVGKWLSATKDDCSLVLSKIRQAQAERVGEPVPWITRALSPPERPPRNVGEQARADLRQLGILPNASDPSSRRLETSLGNGQTGSTGITRQITDSR